MIVSDQVYGANTGLLAVATVAAVLNSRSRLTQRSSRKWE